MERIVIDYFTGVERLLASQYALIASSHSGDKGEAREEILVEVLNNHLPHVARAYRGGQIIDLRDTRSSQTDIVIYSAYAPRLAQSRKPLFLAEGVYGAIEQKSVLTSTMLLPLARWSRTLKRMLKTIDTGDDVHAAEAPTIRTGLFAYESRMSSDAVKEKLSRIASEQRFANYDMPDFINVNGRFILVRDLSETWAAFSSTEPGMTLAKARKRLEYRTWGCTFAEMLELLVDRIQNTRPPYVTLAGYRSMVISK